jgi:uncharacterized cupin superfamily protein
MRAALARGRAAGLYWVPALKRHEAGHCHGRRVETPGARSSRAAGARGHELGDALGLGNFGVNLVTLPPGAGSAQRHWHSHEDEFVYLVEGELMLITEDGEQLLTAGQVAGFPAGRADGHHLVNQGAAPATYLEVGDRNPEDECSYPDIDLHYAPTPDGHVFTNKKGERY